MQRKVTYFLLVLFVIYLISLDAAGTGVQANEFFGWIGDGLTHAQEFTDNLIGDQDNSNA